jgi:cysteinyl-tRNA synthetase
MTIRFFILQTHYRSTLDFSNEALTASEKGLKRLWEAYENLQKPGLTTIGSSLPESQNLTSTSVDTELDEKVNKLVSQFDEFLNDDFNTAKVLANMFELVPVINGIKDKHIAADALSEETLELLKIKMKAFVEDIFGLKNIKETADEKLDGVMQLLIDMRKEAKNRKDYVTSDKIRKELAFLGINLKDEKDGNISYSFN